MADPNHLKILKQGVKRWNKWRKENPGIVPDLSKIKSVRANLKGANLYDVRLFGSNLAHANLSQASLQRAFLEGANLSNVNLKGANLSEANLFGVNLSGTNLSGANLWNTFLAGANLRGANLTGAFLARADLAHSDLRNANLTSTNLARVDFSRASLINVNLKSATLHLTVFGNTDLTGVKNIESCKYEGPSIIDHMTVSRSMKLSLAFLRGVGLTDSLIKFYSQNRQFYSCFISYSHKDKKIALKLYNTLWEEGVRCWFAPEDLKIGERIRLSIDEKIHAHDKLLLILSKYSVHSNWVEHEVETALEKEVKQGCTVLFPIRLDDAVMNIKAGWAAKIRRERNIGDFREWKNHDAYQKSFTRLLGDLKAELQTHARLYNLA